MLLWVPAAGAVVFASTTSPYGLEGVTEGLAVADFNGDGHPDLVAAGQGCGLAAVSVLLGTGDGGFSTAPGSPYELDGDGCAGSQAAVAVRDFNGDGHLDLAVTTTAGLYVLLANPDGSGAFTLTGSSPIALAAEPFSVAAGDFDAGSKADLAVATSQGVEILLGDGSGGFTEAHFYAEGSTGLRGITAADVNGDGKPDLAETNYVDDDVSVLLSDGSGGFTPASGSPFPVGRSPDAVTAGDLNGDGHPDLAVANAADGDSDVSVLLGDGSGGFSATNASPASGAYPASSAITMADVNKDGHQDLVVASFEQGVSVLLGDGSGGFTAANGSPLMLLTADGTPGDVSFASVAVADFNGDGAPDIAAGFGSGINSGGVSMFPSLPPDSSISAGPAATTRSTSATFRFSSDDPTSKFQCKLDAGGWRACTSPVAYSGLGAGAHTFQVKSTNDVDLTDPTPAGRAWTVDLSTPPVAELNVAPSLALTGHGVTLDASGSHDRFDGTIVDYKWDFGSGAFDRDSGSTSRLSKRFSTPGVKTVRVRVTNAIGGTATASAKVDVRPAPPAGPIGLSIDDGDYATNNRDVRLAVVWPKYASKARVSNDGGFGAAGGTRTVRLVPAIPWKLPSSESSGRLPQTVYLRFPDSAQPTETFTDDIVLDTTKPLVESAALRGSARHSSNVRRPRVFKVRLRARERISGISRATFSRKKSHGQGVTFRSPKRRGITELSRVVQVRMKLRPKWARVRSAAGTWSRWHRIR